MALSPYGLPSHTSDPPTVRMSEPRPRTDFAYRELGRRTASSGVALSIGMILFCAETQTMILRRCVPYPLWTMALITRFYHRQPAPATTPMHASVSGRSAFREACRGVVLSEDGCGRAEEGWIRAMSLGKLRTDCERCHDAGVTLYGGRPQWRAPRPLRRSGWLRPWGDRAMHWQAAGQRKSLLHAGHRPLLLACEVVLAYPQ